MQLTVVLYVLQLFADADDVEGYFTYIDQHPTLTCMYQSVHCVSCQLLIWLMCSMIHTVCSTHVACMVFCLPSMPACTILHSVKCKKCTCRNAVYKSNENVEKIICVHCALIMKSIIVWCKGLSIDHITLIGGRGVQKLLYALYKGGGICQCHITLSCNVQSCKLPNIPACSLAAVWTFLTKDVRLRHCLSFFNSASFFCCILSFFYRFACIAAV